MWKPMDIAPRDGSVILIHQGKDVYAAYWGLAQDAIGAGAATKKYPWVFLDPTNGVNSFSDESAKCWTEFPDAPPAVNELAVEAIIASRS